MENFLSIMQIIIVLFLIIIIFLQKTSSNSLSGLSGGGHNFISNKLTSNILSKLTFFLAAFFMANSLFLAKITINNAKAPGMLIDSIVKEQNNSVNANMHEQGNINKAPKVE